VNSKIKKPHTTSNIRKKVSLFLGNEPFRRTISLGAFFRKIALRGFFQKKTYWREIKRSNCYVQKDCIRKDPLLWPLPGI